MALNLSVSAIAASCLMTIHCLRASVNTAAASAVYKCIEQFQRAEVLLR
jgi:hypothetical protein